MFAGATREVVFANPEVVQRINANFVPVALKAGLVQNPPRGIEGELYRELRRTQAAPQGICVMNSAGKVLDWVLSFENDAAIVDYFDDALERYRSFPLADKKVAVRRFRRFPLHPLSDVEDIGDRLEIPQSHGDEACPAAPSWSPGALVGKVVGRPLAADGKPAKQTHRQEDYMESTLEVSRLAVMRLVAACERSDEEVDVPESLVRDIVGPAYLGQLDVSPLVDTPRSGRRKHWWRFRARPADTDHGRMIRITGQSYIAGEGRQWEHKVALSWQGYVRVVDGRAERLEMLAKGRERLTWEHRNAAILNEPDAAHLMAGHPIDLDSDVIYGLSASRVPYKNSDNE